MAEGSVVAYLSLLKDSVVHHRPLKQSINQVDFSGDNIPTIEFSIALPFIMKFHPEEVVDMSFRHHQIANTREMPPLFDQGISIVK